MTSLKALRSQTFWFLVPLALPSPAVPGDFVDTNYVVERKDGLRFVPSGATSTLAERGDNQLRRKEALETYGRLPLAFEENRGQADPQVRFLSRGPEHRLLLAQDGASLVLPQAKGKDPTTLVLRLIGANPNATITGQQPLLARTHYFLGRDPLQWRTNVPQYARAEYRNVYPGVNLVYYSTNRLLEHDFIVAPRSDPRAIAFEISGAKSQHLDSEGNLIEETDGGEVQLRAPVAYQEGKGKRSLVPVRYVLTPGGRVRFEVPRYDASRELVIDPVLVYSTYLGGSSFDHVYGIAVDGAGSVYVTGETDFDFPTTPGVRYPHHQGSRDAFVTKFDPVGGALIFSTYLGGGSNDDFAYGIAVDSTGHAYVTGQTYSADFPTTPGAFQESPNGIITDAFVTKLAADGSSLVYSTYLGGQDGDLGRAIAVDATGSAYVVGWTTPEGPFGPYYDFPTTSGAFEPVWPGGQVKAFVTKLNAAGSHLVYSSFIGGTASDNGLGVAVTPSGEAYVAGITTSADFPTTPGAFQRTFASSFPGDPDAFVVRMNAAGSSPIYSTYLGGDGDDEALAVAIDAAGSAFVTGKTEDGPFRTAPFPTTAGAVKTSTRGTFVTKIDPAGGSLAYSAIIGDSNFGRGIAVDLEGNAYVAGHTGSATFPVTNDAFQKTYGGPFTDGFVAQLDPSGGTLLFASYLGGAMTDDVYAIAADAYGNCYVGGDTNSANFPTMQPFQAACPNCSGGITDGFVAKIGNPSADLSLTNGDSPDPVPTLSSLTYTLAVKNNGPGVATHVLLSDPLPAGLAYSSGSGGCSLSAGTVMCELGTLSAGQSATRTVIFGVTGSPGLVTNTASVAADQDDPDATNNSATQVTTVTPVTIEFGQAEYVVGEAAGKAAITVRRSNSSGTMTVHYATSDGTAAAGLDYLATSGTLTFGPRIGSAVFVIPITNDTIAEGDETVDLTLTAPTGGAILGPQPTATLRIVDSDAAGSLSFTRASYRVADTATSAVITVSRVGGAASAVTVDYAAAAGSAIAGADFTPVSGTLTFGAAVASQTFKVPIVNGTIAEGPETVLLSLSNPQPAKFGATLSGPSTAVLTIAADDLGGTIQFSPATYSVNSAAGPSSVTVTAKRTSGMASGVTVHYATNDGTAKAGADYTATSGDLAFTSSGSSATTQSFSVPVAQNLTGAKSFSVTLSGPMGGAVLGTPPVATVTILGVESTLAFSSATYNIKTSQPSALITVKRSAPLAGPVTVGYATSALTAVPGVDYNDVSGTLTFASGVSTRTFSVPVMKDPYVDITKIVQLTLGTVSGDAISDPVLGTSTLNITDPNLVPTVQFSAATYTANEATPKAIITVKRTGDLAGTVTVDYGVTGGSATLNSDYSLPAGPGTLTFGPGKTVQTFPIAIVNDLFDEGTETVELALTNQHWDNGVAAIGALGTAALNITDNEPTVQFSSATYSVSEALTTASVVVKRTGSLAGVATTDYTVTGGTATGGGVDYTLSTPGTLTFLANQAVETISIPLVNDTVAKGSRTIDLGLSNSTGAQLGTPNTTEVTIKDNDLAGKVQFIATDLSVDELAGVATIAVTRTGGASSDATVNFATSDGSAVGSIDYTPISGTLTFAANQKTATFQVTILDDTVSNAGAVKNLQLTLSTPIVGSNGLTIGTPSTATLWIVKD